jgi:tetratricopeptide (TPR) repeat protein
VFWLDATNTATIEQGYKDIGATIRGPEDGQMSLDAARGLLASLSDDWLLLVDGADDANALSGFWPSGQNGNILYTSRNPVLKDLTSDAACEVAGMEDDDAVELLLDSARLKPASGEVTQLAREIVAELGHLALAVDQAGAYIARGECRFHDFLATFERHRASLLSVDAYHRATPDTRAVYATWELSYSAIQRIANGEPEQDSQVEVARNAVQLLNMLSFFHYENITEDIYKRAAENPKSGSSYPVDVDPDQLLAGDKDLPDTLLPLDRNKQWDAHPFRKCVCLLNSYSLLWVNTLSGTISMHRLVHRWAFDRLPPHSRYASLLSSEATLAGSLSSVEDVEVYAIGRDLLPHIVALFHQASVANVDPLCNAYQMTQMGIAYSINGRWNQASALIRRALELEERLLGPGSAETLASMAFLAQIIYHQGRRDEAGVMICQVYEIVKRVHGPEHPLTLGSMGNLAGTIREQGRAAEAEALYQQALCMMRRVLGPEHPETLASMGNLASAILDQGRAAEAERLYQQVLCIGKRVLGPEHPGTLASMGSLASAILDQGRAAEAEALCRQQLCIQRRVLGSEHPDTLTTMHDLALALRSLGDADDAVALMINCYELRNKTIGENHPDTRKALDAINRWLE